MLEVRDVYGHLICVIHKESGMVDAKYKNFKSNSVLLIGKSCTFQRDGAITTITRVTSNYYEIESIAVA